MVKKIIEKELIPFMEKVLNKYNITYNVSEVSDGSDNKVMYISCDLSVEEYDNYEEEAMCLQQQGDKRTPVIPFRIFADEEKRKEFIPGGSCRILERDTEKFRKYLEDR